VSGEISCLVDLGAATFPGWLTGPQWWSYHPELNELSAIPFSVDLRETTPTFRKSPMSFMVGSFSCALMRG